MPEMVWNRMYMAKQPDGGGGFFRPSKIQEAGTGKEMLVPDPNRRYVAGLDLGKKQDYTVFVVKDAMSRKSVYALEMSGSDWVSQIETITQRLLDGKIGS